MANRTDRQRLRKARRLASREPIAQQERRINTAETRGPSEVTERNLETGARTAVLVFARTGSGYIGNPAMAFSVRLFRALRRPATPDVTVKDATGKIIAIIDGETRQRRPVA